MGFIKAQEHTWKIGLGLYLLLVLCSHLYINFSEVEKDISSENLKDASDYSILYFKDPLLFTGLEKIKSVKEFSLIVISYNPVKTEYTFSNTAEYANHILDSLEMESVQIIGEGIGGGAAIQFASKFPKKVKSLTLLNSNGVEELELLGGFHLNHTVYGAKLTFFKIVSFLTPHFGQLKNLEKRILSSKIQYDSNQRLIRPALENISVPVLVQHTYDAKILIQSSEETYRLVPQSVLKVYDEEDSTLLIDVSDFINKNERSNNALEISAERRIQSLLPFNEENGVKAEGEALAILMLVIILSTLVSEDLTCIGTGLIIARGLIGFWPGALACLFGIFFGDILLYLAGRWLATSTLHKAPLKWFINEKDIHKSYQWFEAKGPAIIIASRFIPGTRFPTYFSAGAIGANFWMFILYFGVASVIWTPTLVGLAVLLGKQMMTYFGLYQEYALWVLLGLLSIIFVLFKIIIPLLTFKGRRILFGKWQRITNWEFWSPFITYTFVMIYVVTLWLKHKSATIFTLANPGIPEGGFIKESKKEILDGIKAKEMVANYILLEKGWDSDQKLSKIQNFMNKHSLGFPIVVKPDIGERGRGVVIPKNEKELKDLIPQLDSNHIVQQFIEGNEYGIFYYRFPNENTGKIFSITEKVYLKLRGDGIHTLEELILKDKRAVCLAEIHFDRHVNELYHIPEKGHLIPLVELGTHARGAIFYDDNNSITYELTKEIDRISKSFNGFYFGRYDIKVPSKEKLKRGEGLTIIELNGVTSESTNIYDPKHSFFFGVRTLIKQWKIVYEIGSQVKSQHPDLETPSIKHMLRLLS